jgi:hypothetical protein
MKSETKTGNKFSQCVTYDSNKSKLHARINSEQIKSGKCLIPFSPEFAAFPFVSKNINATLHVALNKCETWSLTITEEHRLRVFKNRVLREVFQCMKEEVTGE